MDSVEKLKQYIDSRLFKARGELITQDQFESVFILAPENGDIIEMKVATSPEDKAQELTKFMRNICGINGVKSCALIFNCATLLVDVDKADDCKNILSQKDTRLNILTYLYTPDSSRMRKIQYKKKGDLNYLCQDFGWETLDGQVGDFKNPFKAN